MQAGFAKVKITPPLGTTMMGIGSRDIVQGCTEVHDDIFVRALYCEHAGEAALIMSFDLCFIGRSDSDRLKGALGRVLDLLPRQILLSATHSHTGPEVGDFYTAGFTPPNRLYRQMLEAAVLEAALAARASAEEVTLHTGCGRSTLPMNRRLPKDGEILNAPNPEGEVCDVLPVCLLQNEGGEPVCLLFSVATHPSIVRGWETSAEYPGVACDLVDEYLGRAACLFLQGAGGDSKPATIAAGDEWAWDASWPEMEETGQILARETIACLEAGLTPVEPKVASALLEMEWPLQPVERSFFETMLSDPETVIDPVMGVRWAERQLERLDKYGSLPAVAPILLQGIQIGEGVRLLAMEGEPVGHYGNMMLEAYPKGVTFPLGYANGEGLYLVTSPMVDEGGMEAVSYYQFGFPAPLAKGAEVVVESALRELQSRGIA